MIIRCKDMKFLDNDNYEYYSLVRMQLMYLTQRSEKNCDYNYCKPARDIKTMLNKYAEWERYLMPMQSPVN